MNKKKMLKHKQINCNNIEEKLKNKNQILEFLGMGTYGVAFLGCLDELCNEKVGVKFIAMKNKYNIDNTHPARVEIIIGMKLSKLVDKNITPHINYTYRGFTCHIDKLKELKTIKNSEWFKKTIFDEYSNTFRSNFNINFLKDIMINFNEIADTDLKKYVIERYENNNPLSFNEHLNAFFCFCYTMSNIVFYNPNYRHNDIKPNNILLELVDKSKIKKNNYIKYKIFGKVFYLPQLEFIIKLHDFDYSNCDKYPNQKITKFGGLFKEINATPFTNPLYDLHEYINFYIRDFGKYIKDSEIEHYFKSLLSKGTFGEENTYTRRYKLTNFKVNGDKDHLSDEQRFNYIPTDMKTPSELILTDNKFKLFNTLPSNGVIIKSYDSFIPNPNSLFNRKDMFNVLLKS